MSESYQVWAPIYKCFYQKQAFGDREPKMHFSYQNSVTLTARLTLIPLTYQSQVVSIPNIKPWPEVNNFLQILFNLISALYNEIDRLKDLINRGHTNNRDETGYTALHYAARKNNREACQLLIKANANINAATNGGVTSLQRAAMMGKILFLLLFLQLVSFVFLLP